MSCLNTTPTQRSFTEIHAYAVEEAARRYPDWDASTHQKMANRYATCFMWPNADIAYDYLKHPGLNKVAERVFMYATGIKLARTQKARREQLDTWARITPAIRAEIDAQRKKARKAKDEQQRQQRVMRDTRAYWGHLLPEIQSSLKELAAKGGRIETCKRGAVSQWGIWVAASGAFHFWSKRAAWVKDFNRFLKNVHDMISPDLQEAIQVLETPVDPYTQTNNLEHWRKAA